MGRENADNYVWFALEAFFSRFCLVGFGDKEPFDPPRASDWNNEHVPEGGDDMGAPGGRDE